MTQSVNLRSQLILPVTAAQQGAVADPACCGACWSCNGSSRRAAPLSLFVRLLGYRWRRYFESIGVLKY
ncbi:hypothetical protein [Chroococcidiopsis sp. CCMEE 29]|uniref:hypothetical protein n=1 Tax=Chroococcidiopsis sp. CCMEE 29 TaxID=155894 RepID=UPI0020226B8E|nr:hypothetical protein [Chroococcidiopsis sp. CCMEE 29]